jgi:hypothetical protein
MVIFYRIKVIRMVYFICFFLHLADLHKKKASAITDTFGVPRTVNVPKFGTNTG